MQMTLLRFAAIVGIGGSLLAVAVPAFVRNLSASKTTEALEGLQRIANNAVSNAATHEQAVSFPPGVELTPAEVPRGIAVKDAPGTWDHLTWRALDFRMENDHAYSFKFDSSFDRVTSIARFAVRAHGDLDGDGNWSTFEVRGERLPGEPAKVMAGLLVTRELE
ncbi:MAG: hypothetical protein HOW73_33680 [Polyangiaceae bacterium]|nr:hypothetical protein [Polyangiaceae bacterium]